MSHKDPFLVSVALELEPKRIDICAETAGLGYAGEGFNFAHADRVCEMRLVLQVSLRPSYDYRKIVYLNFDDEATGLTFTEFVQQCHQQLQTDAFEFEIEEDEIIARAAFTALSRELERLDAEATAKKGGAQ